MATSATQHAPEKGTEAADVDGDGRPARQRKPFKIKASTLWVLGLSAVLAYLILVPVATVVWGSFRDGPPGTAAAYSAIKYKTAYGDSALYKAALSTVLFAVGSTVLATALGGYLAWLTSRTNVRGKVAITGLALFPIMLPGVLTSIAWVLLLNPSIGLVNKLVSGVLGVDGPVFNSYSIWGMIWAQAVDNITLPFLLIAAALRSMDPSLEEASAAAGASRIRTFRKVTLPLMRPVLLAVGLLMFLRGIESFEVPAVMGIPGGIHTFSTVVWLATTNSADYNLAAAYAVGYVVVAAAGLALYYRALSSSERFATVTGKAFRPTVIDLGRSAWAHAVAGYVIVVVSVVLPVLVIIWASLQPFFVAPSRKAFESVNLSAYRTVLQTDMLQRALTNNLKVGLVSATVMVLLATLISWVVLRTKIPGRKLLDAVAFLPVGIPGLVMGLAVLWFYLTVPIPLYGTLTIIGVAFVASYTPYALRGTHAAMTQVSVELEEASQAAGASWLRTFVKVTLPLIAPGMIAAFIFVLSLTFKVLSIPILLFTSGNEVMAVLIYSRYQAGDYAVLSALGVVLVVILSALSAVAYLVGKRFGGIQMQA